jgi:hypothetical protein
MFLAERGEVKEPTSAEARISRLPELPITRAAGGRMAVFEASGVLLRLPIMLLAMLPEYAIGVCSGQVRRVAGWWSKVCGITQSDLPNHEEDLNAAKTRYWSSKANRSQSRGEKRVVRV